MKEFVGAENFEFEVNVIAQARQYVEEMVRVRECDGDDMLKSMKTYWFWVSMKAVWPELAAIALYWTVFPTSSVCVERAFARLRAMDAPTRSCMTLPHTERELKLRVNKPIVVKVLEATLAQLLASV